MSVRTLDPLLVTGKAIVIIGQWLMAIAGITLLIALPLAAIFADQITAAMRLETGNAALALPLPMILPSMGICLAIVALMFLFFRNLLRIVRTVSEGDPFVPANAQRLTHMAWIMLAVEMLTLALAPLAYRIGSLMAEETLASESTDVDLSGIIMVVTLFILARVFRQGAAMRDDLEGTV
ncbi:hypothetical protein PK98_13330 [Croceibacterium mercuriale]|uniref:DUF2975 domain-containing protein n=1 Tax=Croceibacterium mercuriale TaxID=1572751 RepID=A0A0B2BYF2_9SPHN|nr:DUF2975 domain-containing protein [Croceibacterium mercuriale]KHL24860.1 hypothetical protein PK98_13330 [Croceibacterium mercuriale]